MQTRPRGKKAVVMLNSAEHDFLTENKNFSSLKQSNVAFILLINVKMPNFMLSQVEPLYREGHLEFDQRPCYLILRKHDS